MAGDWIKIQHALPDKPEVVQMASELGIDQDAVVGKLIRLWVWADQQSADGNALSVTEAFLDRVTFSTGFAQALRSVAWLAGEGGELRLPNFDRHNGNTAKTRANGQKRSKASRSRNTSSVTKVTPAAQPEKRREEKRIIEPPIYTPGEGIQISPKVNTTAIREAVGRWVAHINASDTHKSIEPDSPQEDATWRLLASWAIGEEATVSAIDAAIAGEWQNLRKPEAPRAERQNGKPQGISAIEALDEMIAKGKCNDMIEEEKRSEQF